MDCRSEMEGRLLNHAGGEASAFASTTYSRISGSLSKVRTKEREKEG
jgi:hypothetical protein